ncbi:MAG TPA: hypothetical protein VED59_09360 [Acidimicrobiales bacterium]|nr:hypothetical protein [Acidimicrobiales bacterium]
MNEHLNPGCALVEDDLVELALGTLSGKQRVAALAHVDNCPRCSAEVEELSTAADELLHLAPLAEPPLGFESHVFERLGLHPKPSHRLTRLAGRLKGRPRLVVALAALAVVVVLGIGTLVGYGTANRGPQVATQGELEVGHFHAGTRTVGEVIIYNGNPTWLFMYVDDAAWHGELRCQVVLDHGPTLTLGTFWPSQGKGAWAASVKEPAGRLREARVVDAADHLLATADLA